MTVRYVTSRAKLMRDDGLADADLHDLTRRAKQPRTHTSSRATRTIQGTASRVHAAAMDAGTVPFWKEHSTSADMTAKERPEREAARTQRHSSDSVYPDVPSAVSRPST